MIYLLLSVVFSSGLFVIFKYFDSFQIDILKAIFVNYIVAFVLGFAFADSDFLFVDIPGKPWFLGAVFLGFLFVAIFFVMAKTAQENGVSVASIAGKMSVVIPVFFGVFLYKESTTLIKILGIVLALIAVYLSAVKKEKNTASKAGLLFPMLLFLGSGVIDTTLKYVEVNFVNVAEVSLFSGSLFGFAATIAGVLVLGKFLKKKEAFGFKNLLAGVVLGIPNYYSIVFLIKSLQTKSLESSTLFTINNVAIVVMSTLLGIILFKEEFSIRNKIGFALAIVAIVIVALA